MGYVLNDDYKFVLFKKKNRFLLSRFINLFICVCFKMRFIFCFLFIIKLVIIMLVYFFLLISFKSDN